MRRATEGLFQSVSRKVYVLAMLGLVIVLAFQNVSQGLRPGDTDTPMPKAPPAQPPYARTEKAANPERMLLLVDDRKVVGWLSGIQGQADKPVQVDADGKLEKAAVAKDNTFVWEYAVSRPMRVTFSWKNHKETVMVKPAANQPPSVFFVVDRHVFRPNQTLHFAGFLRELDEKDEFIPMPNKPVEVQLRTDKKSASAANLKLTSDEMGRITGEYKFTEADAIDTYTLSIRDFKGSARVALAEYRKSKVELKIASERQGDKLKLRFQALDFLGQPVPAQRVQWKAYAVQSKGASPGNDKLKPEHYVYAPEATQGLFLEDLHPEDQLLVETEPDYIPGRPPLPAASSPVKGNIDLAGQSSGEATLPLKDEWLRTPHTLFVDAVLVDNLNREERSSLGVFLDRHFSNWKLELPHTRFDVNQPITASISRTDGKPLPESIPLVVMSIKPNPAPLVLTPVPGEPRLATLVTATTFKSGKATLRLDKPGAYKLIATAQGPDGEKVYQEIGCVVLDPKQRPALTLDLERTTLQTGGMLTGTVSSRFADARVFLTLRDGTGLRLWKVLELKNGKAEIKERLPEGIHYGCVLAVQYANTRRGVPDTVSRQLRVEPTDRMLTIQSKLKPDYQPGEKVVIDLEVNRKEPVDLVVSVFDQALSRIKPAKNADIQSFYLADGRVLRTHPGDLLRRLAGQIRVDALIDRAIRRLQNAEDRDWPADQPLTPESLRSLIEHDRASYYDALDLVTLLGLAGVQCQLGGPYPWQFRWSYRRLASLAEVLDADHNGWRMESALLGTRFVLWGYHPTQRPNPWPSQPVMLLGGISGNFGGISGGGMGISGGICGVGGNVGGIAGGVAGAGGNNGFGGFQGGPSALPQAAPQLGPAPPMPQLFGPEPGQDNLLIRRDFSDSAYWNTMLRTDANGKARAEFTVPDSLTTWQVIVTAISKDMHLGEHRAQFNVVRPVMIAPNLPRAFTAGDKVQVSATLCNRAAQKQTLKVRLKADNGKVEDEAEKTLAVESGKTGAVYWTFQAGDPGFCQLLFSVEGAAGSDASLKRLPVHRPAVEDVLTWSGFCKDKVELEIPPGVDLAGAKLEVRLAPTLAADLVDTLDYLVEYPYGCVEQTMSRFLPAIKVAQMLKQTKLEHPKLAEKLPFCVAAGIKRLLELQQADGGWGWQGAGRSHEFMTPYALYGLLQAEKAGYLIGSETAVQRGLQRLEQFIGGRQAKHRTDQVFCMYVYGHRHNLKPEWWKQLEDELRQRRLTDYGLALVLELAVTHKRNDLAAAAAEQLRQRAVVEHGQASWRTGGFSRWADDRFEITAAALKALIVYDMNDSLIAPTITYFMASKRGNRWNSTKDTALILQALCEYLTRQGEKVGAAAKATFRCNDGPETAVLFDSLTQTRQVTVPGDQLRGGKNLITFSERAPGVMYRLVLRYWQTGTDITAREHGIQVSRQLYLLDRQGKRLRQLSQNDKVPLGSYVECVVTGSLSRLPQARYVLVESPRPTGCEVVPEEDSRFEQQSNPKPQLREDRETLVAFHHKQVPQQVVDRCVFHAEMAGTFVVSPARIELMYQTEVRGHSSSFRLRVGDRFGD